MIFDLSIKKYYMFTCIKVHLYRLRIWSCKFLLKKKFWLCKFIHKFRLYKIIICNLLNNLFHDKKKIYNIEQYKIGEYIFL